MRNYRIFSICVHLCASVVPSVVSPCLRGGISFSVILLALLIHGGVLLLTPGALETDPDGYRRLAENLVEQGTFGTEVRCPLRAPTEGWSGEGQGEGKPHSRSSPALTLTLSQRERGLEPTAYRPPLYPLLLTGCVALGDCSRMAIGMLHLVLGVATVGLTLVLGRWWGLGNRGASLAALLVACDPILLGQSTQVMTETPAAFLTAAGLLVLTLLGRQLNCRPESGGNGCGSSTAAPTWAAILAGATLALGALCRPTLLLWTIAAGVVLFLRTWHLNSRELTAPGKIAGYLRLPAAFALGVLLVLSPWTIRNQLQFGRPIVTTTHGGYTLLLANNPEFYQWLRSGPWGSVWRADGFNAGWDRRKPRDELQADRLAYSEACKSIRREPGTFAYACLVRIGRFWSPLPHQVAADEAPLGRLSRYAVAVWYLAEFMLVAVGLWRVSPRPRAGEGPGVRAIQISKSPNLQIPDSPSPSWLWGLLLVACLTAVHAVFWTDMRMRAPLMPVVALAAAAGMFRRRAMISSSACNIACAPNQATSTHSAPSET